MPSTRIAAKIFSPLAYVALILAAILAALFTVRTLESGLGSESPIYVYVIGELLVSGVVLYAGGSALLSLEELWRPKVLDHLRRCAFLYLVFIPLGTSLVAFVDLGDPGGGGSLAIMLCIAAGYAILVDAVLLFVARRRSGHQRFRSHA